MGDGKCIGAGAFEADEHTLGLWHFNENYRDSSKNTNDGTPNGDVHFIESKYGQGAYFNGNGDYIDCGNDVSLQIRGDITIEAWVNMGSPNGLRRIVSKDDLTNRNYYLHTLNGVPFVGIFQSGMELKTIGTTDLRNTGWRYIVGVNDGTNLMIYVDGILEKSEVKGGTIDNDPVNFLVGSRGGTEYFNGIIDEVRISNVARNPEEIRQTYQAGIVIRGGQAQLGENEIGPGPGSVGYWSFDEGRGDKAYDGSGNGNDGAVKGAEWVEGIHGYALDFSGEDDVIDLPDSDNLLGIIKDFTIHARIPHNGYSIGGTILNLNYISVSSDRGNGIIFSLGGTSIPIATFYLEDDIDGKMYTLVGDKSLEPMSLNLVTLRKEHTILSLYLNGIEINSIQVSDKNLLFSYDVNTHTGDYNSIGKYHHQNGDYAWPFNGIINEISVFNHAQTPREIYNHSRLYRPNATLRSETVTLPNNHTWDIFQFTRSIPENTFLNISVHDARTNDTLFNISGNDAKGYIDLSSINVLEHSSIYLQAYFQSNRTQTPVIYDWAVNWTPIIQPTLKDEIKQIPIYEETLEVNILNLSDYFYDEYSEIGPTRYAIQNISNNNLTLQLNHSILDVVSLVENFTGNVSVIVNCTNIYNRTTSSNPFNITVINIDDIPIWRTIPEITMIEDEEYITNWSLDGYIFDAEKDECGFSVRSTTKKLKINITADYRLLIVPVNNFHGRANIGIRAFEISNTSLYGDVNISIYVAPKNDAPFVTLLSPGNNTTINDIDVTFNWQVLDVDDDQENITFDLYLGESDPPGVYLSDITTSSMTIRNLEDGATYYWYIKPSDGKIAGLCLNGSWSFNIDTKIYVPEVTLHSPLNGSVLNSMEANLTWEAVNPTENELMFNIYVGTSKEGLSLNGTTKGNRYLLGSLKENTTYYWKVIPLAETLQGKCTSGTWHFSVNTTFEIFYNITVEIDIEELEIVQGENASFNITLINYGNVPTLVELSGSGIIYGILDLPKTVTLQKGESHKVLATINRTSSIYPDLYELNLEITYLGGFESFVIPVNITSAYKPIVDDNESETVKRSSDPNLLFYIIGITVLFVILAIGAFLIIRKKRVKEEDEDDDELNGVDIVKPEESPFIKSSQPSPPTIEQQSQPFSPSVKHSSYLLKTERAVPGAFTLPPQPLKEGEQSIENILSGIKTGKPLASPPPPSPQSPPLGLLPQATDSTTLETPPVPLQPVPSGPQIVGIDTQFSVSDIFLIYVDGRLVKSVSLGTKLSEGMDEDIMSGMLTAITDFIKDSFSEESGALKTLQYGKMAIYLERGVSMYLAVVFHGHPPHNLREKMRWLLIHLWETYKIKLKVWDGSYDGLDGLDSMLTGLMGLTEPAVRGTAPEAPMVDGGSGQATISTVTEAVMCGICMGVVKPGLEIMMCYCSGKYHRACGERIGTCPKCNTLLSVPVEPPKTMIAAPREEVPLPAGYMPPPPEEILNDDTKYLPEYSGQKAGETGDLKIDV